MDWISAQNPIASIGYDVRNPPSSSVIATYTYSGPPLGACGNPTITIADGNNGPTIDFIIATFDSTTGSISVSLPDKSTAVKGDYTLFAVFTKPGAFRFQLGISLSVFDICDNSVFPSAPVLGLDS